MNCLITCLVSGEYAVIKIVFLLNFLQYKFNFQAPASSKSFMECDANATTLER